MSAKFASRLFGLAGLACLATAAGVALADPPPPKSTAADAAIRGPKLTEARALDAFRHGNLQLVAARHDLEASRADIVAAGVLPNPSLLVGTSFLAHGAPQSGRNEYAIAIDQVLPVGGQVGLRRKVAAGFADAAEREFAATAWVLSCDVRMAYADVQRAQAKALALSSGLADLQRVETIINERAGAGANAEYDRLRVQVELRNLTGRLSEAQAELAQARSALALAVGPGLDPHAWEVESEIPDAPDAPTDLQSLTEQARFRRPELAAARLRAQAAGVRVSQVRREYFPSPSVQVGYSYWSGLPVDSGPSTGGGIMIGLGIPLPILDSGQGRVDRASAEQHASQARLRFTEMAIERETSVAVQTMRGRVEAWRSFRDSIAGSVERMRTIADVSYRESRIAIMELLDTYRAQLESRERSIDLRASAWQSFLSLQRVLGPARAQDPAPANSSTAAR